MIYWFNLYVCDRISEKVPISWMIAQVFFRFQKDSAIKSLDLAVALCMVRRFIGFFRTDYFSNLDE